MSSRKSKSSGRKKKRDSYVGSDVGDSVLGGLLAGAVDLGHLASEPAKKNSKGTSKRSSRRRR